MQILGCQFKPESGGQFEMADGGQFHLAGGGQFEWIFQFVQKNYAQHLYLRKWT